MWLRAVSATAALRNSRFSGVLVRRLVPRPMRVSCLSPSGTVEAMSLTYPFSPFWSHRGTGARPGVVLYLQRAVRRFRGWVLIATGAAMLAAASSAYAFDAAQEAQNFSKITERERYITATPEFQTAAAAAERQGRGRVPEDHRQRPGAELRGQHLRAPDERVRGRRPLLRLAEEGLRPHAPGPVHGPRRRDALGHRVGDALGPGEAAGHRHHHRLGAGAGDALLGPGGDARQARLRRPHLRRPGPGPLGHASARARTGRRACPRRPASPSTTAPRTRSTSSSRTPRTRTCRRRAAATPTTASARATRRKQKRRVNEGFDAAVQPVLEDARPLAGGHRRPLAGRRGRLLRRPDRPARGRDRRLGQPERPERPSRPARRAPRRGRDNAADHEAGAWACRPTTSSSRSPTPSDPDPQAKNQGFLAYKKAGVDSMEIDHPRRHPLRVLVPARQHGGLPLRHRDPARRWTWSPGTRPPGSTATSSARATPRCKRSADRRLLTNRWRNDSEEGAVDPNGDPNMYSFYYRSRYDFHVPGDGEVTLRRHARGLPDDGAGQPAAELRLLQGRDHAGRALSPQPSGRL